MILVKKNARTYQLTLSPNQLATIFAALDSVSSGLPEDMDPADAYSDVPILEGKLHDLKRQAERAYSLRLEGV